MRRRVQKIQDTELSATLRSGLEKGSYLVVDAIRVMRVLEGMSLEALSKRSGVTKKVIKAIDAGIGNPKIATLEKIAASFKLRVAFVRNDGQLQLFDAQAWSADRQKSCRARSFARNAGPVHSPGHERLKSVGPLELGYALQSQT